MQFIAAQYLNGNLNSGEGDLQFLLLPHGPIQKCYKLLVL